MVRRSSWKVIRKKLTPYKLLIPQIILSIIFLTGLVMGLVQSFGIIPSLGLANPTLKYYIEIFSKPSFVNSIVYSLKIALISSILATLIGLLISAILVIYKKENSFFTKVIQIPIIVPHVIVALLIVNILSQNGIIARIGYILGFIQEQQEFPKILFDKFGIGVILGYLWKEIPFIIYFIISFMSKINNELGEAAINLGASKWKAFYKVTLPLCKSIVLNGFLIIFIFSLGAYELPALLGATTPKALPVLTYIEYIHPDLQNRPYAMALNGITIIISIISTIIYFFLLRNNLKNLRRRIENNE